MAFFGGSNGTRLICLAEGVIWSWKVAFSWRGYFLKIEISRDSLTEGL